MNHAPQGVGFGRAPPSLCDHCAPPTGVDLQELLDTTQATYGSLGGVGMYGYGPFG